MDEKESEKGDKENRVSFFGQPRWLKRAKHAGYAVLFEHDAAFPAALSLADALPTIRYLFDLVPGMLNALVFATDCPGVWVRQRFK